MSEESGEIGEDSNPTPPRRPDTVSELIANRPFIICVLYLSTYLTGISSIVGVVLAYAFKAGQTEEWEESHYIYLIRTFWILVAAFVIALTGGLIASAMTDRIGYAVLFGLLFFAAMIFLAVRTIYSMVNAVRQKPMPRPHTFLI